MMEKLPVEIMHRILNYLPRKAATQTRLLSKAWKTAWDSRPVLYFNKSIGSDASVFAEFLETRLRSFADQRVSVETFTLFWDQNPHDDVIRRWMHFLANNASIRELTIVIEDFSCPYSLDIVSSNTLTTLSLSGIQMKLKASSGSLSFPRMKTLVVYGVTLDDAIFAKLVSGCPALEELTLKSCTGLVNLVVSGGQLQVKRIILDRVPSLTRIVVSVPSLESFSYSGRGRSFLCEIKLEQSEATLKKLSLSRTLISSDWIHSLISRFRALEDLSLEFVFPEPATLKIFSSKLVKLAICNCDLLMDTEICAPNLRELAYTINELPFYSLVNSPLPENVSFTFWIRRMSSEKRTIWMLKFKELFEEINRMDNVVVSIKLLKAKIIIVHEGRSHTFFPVVHHLTELMLLGVIVVDISSPEEFWKHFLIDKDTENIVVASSSFSNLLKYLSENRGKMDRPVLSILESFRMENFDGWTDVVGNADSCLALSTAYNGSPFRFTTRFNLSWSRF